MPSSPTTPILLFTENMKAVDRLLEIHQESTGTGRGRRKGVEVLNKSAVVLITACLEACIEDIATEAFDFMLSNTGTHSAIPKKVRVLASNPLRTDRGDEARVWQLAGEGWRQVLKHHRDKTVAKLVESVHSPAPEQIDKLFEALLGLRNLSRCWTWSGTSPDSAMSRLRTYLKARGAIAHRVSTEQSVTKRYAENYRLFAWRVAVKTSNRTGSHVLNLVGKAPWV